jgi:hypothetical protein
VVLAENPTGPRLTVLGADEKDGRVTYLVVWRDPSGERCEGEFPAEQLMLREQVLS